jgi:hypothetical protein
VAKSKKSKKSAAARRASQRSLQLRYPHYVPCQHGEAERELGPARSKELEDLYQGPLQRADVELEKLLAAGRFTIVDDEHPDGHAWTLTEYADDWNKELAEDARRNQEATDTVDEEWLIRFLHDSHARGEMRLTADLTLHWV